MTTRPFDHLTIKLPPLPWLSEREIAALEAYCEGLVQVLGPEHIKSVILYGSKARGDAHPYSDIDLLVVLDPGDETQKRAEREINDEVSVNHHLALESMVMSAHKAAGEQALGVPLMQNIADEGIVLLGKGITVNPLDTKRFVQEYMHSAQERLRNAKILLDNSGFRGCVSNSYYACLDAADAALIAVGVMPRSHEGTRTFLSEKFIKTKLLPETYKDIFQDLQYERTVADYHRDVHASRSDAESALERAKEFVAVIEKLLPSLLPPGP